MRKATEVNSQQAMARLTIFGFKERMRNSGCFLVFQEMGQSFLCGFHALFTELVSVDFSKFFFKTKSHGFSVFSNKRYPNKF